MYKGHNGYSLVMRSSRFFSLVVSFSTFVFGSGALAATTEPAKPEQADLATPENLQPWFDGYGASAVWNRGFDGRGWSVVVMDEGIDSAHPLLANRIVEEVCTSNAASVASGSARLRCNGDEYLVAGPGASAYTKGDPYNEHGTKMVGAVLLWAPGVSVISIKSHGDHLGALDWVIRNASRYRIAAVNMSFGRSWYPRDGFGLRTCDRVFDGVWAARFEALRNLGIAPVVASMNEGQLGKIGLPACNSNAVSVGSHYLGEKTVRVDSNVSPELSLLGPSGYVTSTNLANGAWAVSDGTSAAAPVVSAMFAIGKQARPSATVDELLTAARASATRIDDVIVKDLRLINFERFLAELTKPTIAVEKPILKPGFSNSGSICLNPSQEAIPGVRPPTIGYQAGTSEYQPTWYHCYGATKAWARGFDGSGWSVAVLDNGIDRAHPLFAGRIVEEVCTSRGQSGWMGCPGGQHLVIGAGASASDGTAPVASHGTAMVGGVLLWAPGVKVISIKSYGDHFAALDWVIANAEKYKIAAVSMSFGQQWLPRSQPDPSNCNSLGEGDWTSRFKLLRDNGVIPVVAAMNEGNLGNIGLPACNSYAVSVGSHFVGAPRIDNTSNVSPQLSLVGPSGYVTATNEYLKTWDRSSGTSAAAPVVAAMFAIGRQAKPLATSDELIRVARSSATRMDDLLVKDLRVVQFDKFIEELVAPSSSATPKSSNSKVMAQPCKKVGTSRVVGGRVQQCRRVNGRQVWISSR